jgi:hypothetical protein
MKSIPGLDKEEGYEGYYHDHCEECGGVTCGFVHKGEYPCECEDHRDRAIETQGWSY